MPMSPNARVQIQKRLTSRCRTMMPRQIRTGLSNHMGLHSGLSRHQLVLHKLTAQRPLSRLSVSRIRDNLPQSLCRRRRKSSRSRSKKSTLGPGLIVRIPYRTTGTWSFADWLSDTHPRTDIPRRWTWYTNSSSSSTDSYAIGPSSISAKTISVSEFLKHSYANESNAHAAATGAAATTISGGRS